THVAKDDDAGMDAHAHAQAHLVTLLEGRIRFLESRKQVEAGPHGATCRVLVRERGAEIGDDTVADVLPDRTLVRPARLAAHVLEGAEHFTKFLGVETLGQRRRFRDVAKEHRQMPTLTALLGFRSGEWRIVEGPSRAALGTVLDGDREV